MSCSGRGAVAADALQAAEPVLAGAQGQSVGSCDTPETPLHDRRRERASGVYGTAAYFITTVGWDFLPMRVAPTALFAAVTYWVMGLRPGLGRVASFFGVLVLVNLAGTAMSMAVGERTRETPQLLPVPWQHLWATAREGTSCGGRKAAEAFGAAIVSCWWQCCGGGTVVADTAHAARARVNRSTRNCRRRRACMAPSADGSVALLMAALFTSWLQARRRPAPQGPTRRAGWRCCWRHFGFWIRLLTQSPC